MLMAVIRHSDHDASIFGSPSSTRTYNPLVNSEASGFLGSGSELEGKGRIPLSNFVSSPGVVAVEDTVDCDACVPGSSRSRQRSHKFNW